MEKQIAQWTYLLGLVCLAVAVIWRGMNAFGVGPESVLKAVNYMSFYKGALLLLVVSVASANYARLQDQKP